ncbi:YdbH domain-containing protein [Pseudoalteromonas luteoviolacea]|uniref:Uncharacterized protein n=1 Tax=Pseudoalteromonas luteoviolacea S4054 TaxID=1129367 RepID=A0A0F6AIJ5_9GAMM|nr:YdbH domain-containing protein [Pseudoalteromonas luteoviolacea]AOT07196.1 hypothetical protein S4054249_04690 [Pseudoalteromonas luteoviolacea]AOT12112.1 hypothetical protein S40542_04690 [Pseudoalteromonas luteoviolacea]AOT17025.1 hypothetical protein S4054_04690 [Pseudoalteromonas luteoviolacea]KKE85379.1 hypothetical protein N479_05090 [Pseudoalteromonas luteoviolacea S4054]KZN73727.1 hypothetical protein N481_11500 [Pseudoalteromonas luteoviolacea S4047-1]
MRRFLVYVGISCCLLLITAFIFRSPLSLAVANLYLTQDQGQLNCLEWSVTGLSEIHIRKVCFSHEQANVVGEHISITPELIEVQTLKIEQASETSPQSSKPLKKLSLPLFYSRPLLSVKNALIESPQLHHPLSVSINETELNTFSINGDVQAHVTVASDNIMLNINLSSTGFTPYVPAQIKRLSGQLSVTFDGIQADLAATLQANISDNSVEGCPVEALFSGDVSSNVDANTLSASIDLSKLDINLNGQACKELIRLQQSLPVDVLSASWQLSVPKPFSATMSQLEIPELRFSDSNGMSSIELNHLLLGITQQTLSSNLNVRHYNPELGWLELQSKLQIEDNSLSTQGDWLINGVALDLVDEVIVKDMISQGDFSLTGKFGEVIKVDLSTQTSIGELIKAQASLDNTDLNLDARFTVDMGHFQTEMNKALEVDLLKTFMSAERYRFEGISGKHVLIESQLNLDAQHKLKGGLELEVGSFKLAQLRGKDLAHTMIFNSDLNETELAVQFDGETHLGLVATPQLSFRHGVVTSTGHFSEQLNLEHVVHLDELEVLAKQKIGPQLNELDMTIPEQSFLTLQPIIQQLDPKLQLSEGTISAKLKGDMTERAYLFDMTLEEGGILYDSHYLSGINMPITGQAHADHIIIEESQISIREIRSGAVIENVQAILSSYDGQPMLSNISAYIFDGQLSAEQVSLSKEDQSFLVEAENWDLAVIANAAKNAGVELSGRVYGQLPVTVIDGKLEIHGGKLNNIDVGLLSIENNQSVEALKAQQPSLETAFGMLERLNIEKLSSDVNMTADGWLDLGVQITGVNEQQGQPINFNYTHKENIFQLFRALRLSDEITKEVEKALN